LRRPPWKRCDFDSAATDSVRRAGTNDGISTEELHCLEVELPNIIERIDSIRTLARDLKQIPNLTAEDAKGLDKVEAR
jgi:PII-like signaling protein